MKRLATRVLMDFGHIKCFIAYFKDNKDYFNRFLTIVLVCSTLIKSSEGLGFGVPEVFRRANAMILYLNDKGLTSSDR